MKPIVQKTTMKREEIEQAIGIVERLVEMSQTEGWACYVKTVEAAIQSHWPSVNELGGNDDAISVSSRLLFVNGMKHALAIVDSQKRKLESLRQQLEKAE